jgi:hypothetical protein
VIAPTGGSGRAFPLASPSVVGNKSLGRSLSQYLQCIGIRKVAIADTCHGGREERVPGEQNVTTPVHAPYSAYRRHHPVACGLIDPVPPEYSFDGVNDRASIRVRGRRALIRLVLMLKNRAHFGQGTPLACAYRGRSAAKYAPLTGMSTARSSAPQVLYTGTSRPDVCVSITVPFFANVTFTVPQKIHREYDSWRDCSTMRKRHSDRHQILAIPCALDFLCLPFPGESQFGITAIPGMRTGIHLLCTRRESADQHIAQEGVLRFRSVVASSGRAPQAPMAAGPAS